jgi:hypothetical protein
VHGKWDILKKIKMNFFGFALHNKILQTPGRVNSATVKEAYELFPKCNVFPVKP